MRNKALRQTTVAAVIAALYVVLTLVSATWIPPIGQFQIRLSEALTILPYFTPVAIPGLFVGCLLSNILTGAAVLDVVFGSIATLLGAVFTYLLRKNKWLAPIPPILSNAIIMPFVIVYVYGTPGSLPFFFAMVGLGQLASCGVIGMVLLFALEKHADRLFK